MKYLLLSLLFLFFADPQARIGLQAAEKIVFGFNASNAPPLLYQFDNVSRPIATGGLIYDVAVAIGDDLQVNYEMVGIPRVRIPKMLNEGRADLNCHNSLDWGQSFSQEVVWSKPLYTYANVLVSKTEIPFSWIDQINNVKIGTVERFFYSDLENLFKNQVLTREDAPSVAISLRKLLSDRVDYVIMSEIEFNYYKATYPFLQRSSFVLGKTEIRCSLSKKSGLTLERLNRTIDRLNKKKVFKKIYERYLDPKSVGVPFSYGLNWDESPPFLLYYNGPGSAVKESLFIDIGFAVAKELKRPINIVLLPRGRLDARLAEGQIELVCYNNEVWAGDYAKQYDWSVPIFRQINYVVGLKGSKDTVLSLEDLKGKRLGTSLHFVYPSLMSFFEQGSIIREDAGSGSANVEKLISQRISYIILNNLEYNYYQKKHVNIQRSPIEVDPLEVKCAVSKKSSLKIEELNRALTDLKRSGRLQQIFYPK
ncbi:substrate-binding periplasmic protein [Bdellovibrio sp. HCB2-146]|uniref:substrate-binding periplasmic protein n=1 Tax=Bdellovibrio sp. HCB2-146 TaxID=3394362 RepID=UPI0039BD6960